MKRRRGFTLLELIVAASLAAGLVMLTAQVFRSALAGRERLQGVSGEMARLRQAYQTISRDMHSAVVPPDDSGLQFGLSAAEGAGAGGGTDVLQFAATDGEPLLAGRAANETVLVQYAVAEDPRTGRPTLWRYETAYPVPEGAAPGTGGDTRALPLLPGVVGASYLFFNAEQQDWSDTWEGQTGLPTAIRIDLALQSAPGGDTANAAPARQESWVFQLPAAGFANDEAAEAAETEAAQ